MKILLSLFCLILISSPSCNQKAKTDSLIQYQAELQRYLRETWNQDLENDHLYILVPTIACGPCIAKSSEYLLQMHNQKELKNYTIISSNQKTNLLLKDLKIKIDSTYKIDYIDFPLNNMTFVTTGANSIKEIFTTNLDNIDSIKLFLRGYSDY